MNKDIELLLRANQLIIRDRKWNDDSFEAKAKAIDEQITELLNPKLEPTIRERTKFAFSKEDSE